MKAGSIKDQVNDLKWQAVIDTAIELFYQNGFRGTSIDMIAEKLGVTKPFIYYRFESKADLLTSVFAHAEVIVVKEAKEVIKSADASDAKYYNLVCRFVETACQHWKLLAVFYTEEQNLPKQKLKDVRRFREEWKQSIIELLEQGRREGYFKFSDAKITVNALMGMVIWMYQWIPDYPKKDRAKIIKEITGCAMALVGTRIPPGVE